MLVDVDTIDVNAVTSLKVPFTQRRQALKYFSQCLVVSDTIFYPCLMLESPKHYLIIVVFNVWFHMSPKHATESQLDAFATLQFPHNEPLLLIVTVLSVQ